MENNYHIQPEWNTTTKMYHIPDFALVCPYVENEWIKPGIITS